MKNSLILLEIMLIILCLSGFSQAQSSTGLGMNVEQTFFPPTSLDISEQNSGELVNIRRNNTSVADTDGDHLSDASEAEYGTNPLIADTDGGSKPDGEEVTDGTDPLNPDDDHFTETVTTTISLHKGWNLISFPILPSSDKISDVLAPISGTYKSLWMYDKGNWYSYVPDKTELSDITTIDIGCGYWIDMESDETLIIYGLNTTGSVPLSTGWNLVGYNALVSRDIASAITSISEKCVSVWAYINGTWKIYLPDKPDYNDLEKLNPGYGYWLRISTNCQWTLP